MSTKSTMITDKTAFPRVISFISMSYILLFQNKKTKQDKETETEEERKCVCVSKKVESDCGML